MTETEIEERVRGDAGGEWDRWKSQAFTLAECLVSPPRREAFVVRGDAGESVWELWLVLEEFPDTRDGYVAFYDEETELFGLGTHASDGRLYMLELCGSTLWDALDEIEVPPPPEE